MHETSIARMASLRHSWEASVTTTTGCSTRLPILSSGGAPDYGQIPVSITCVEFVAGV
jgi:hypothetical protein